MCHTQTVSSTRDHEMPGRQERGHGRARETFQHKCAASFHCAHI